MEYLFSLILLALNLFNYEHRVNKLLFFVVGLALLCAIFYFTYIKMKSFMGTCLALMCHTWSISWINVFGDSSDQLQITWLYIVGVLVVGYFVSNVNKLKTRPVPSAILVVFCFVAILSIYPIILSPSKSAAMKEFIMIGFFLAMVFVSLFYSETLSDENRERVITAYIFCVSVAAALLAFQYFYYCATGSSIFKYSIGNYFGKPMVSSKLLMEDTSSATIMLASGVFYMLERINKKQNRFLYIMLIGITVLGLAFTTRRTSILSLAVCLFIYVFVVYKSLGKKIMMSILMVGMVGVMLVYLATARSIEDMSGLFSLNNRGELMMRSISLFLKHPLGIGYDNGYLESFVEVIPHNTFLRWLNMCGFVLAPAMLFIIIYVVFAAKKKNLTDDFWALACCFVAMNFIPDILNARFFSIPCMLALLSMRRSGEAKNKQLKGRNQLVLDRIKGNRSN